MRDKLHILYWYSNDAFQHNAELLDALSRIEYIRKVLRVGYYNAQWRLGWRETEGKRSGKSEVSTLCHLTSYVHISTWNSISLLTEPTGSGGERCQKQPGVHSFCKHLWPPYASSDNPNTWLLRYQLARGEERGAIKGSLHSSRFSLLLV